MPARTPQTITEAGDTGCHLTWMRQVERAVDDEEYDLGIGCLAAPVRDAIGCIVADLSISDSAGRLTPERSGYHAGS